MLSFTLSNVMSRTPPRETTTGRGRTAAVVVAVEPALAVESVETAGEAAVEVVADDAVVVVPAGVAVLVVSVDEVDTATSPPMCEAAGAVDSWQPANTVKPAISADAAIARPAGPAANERHRGRG